LDTSHKLKLLAVRYSRFAKIFHFKKEVGYLSWMDFARA